MNDCSCGNEDGCIGVGEGCRCVCHHHEIIEDRNWWKKEAGDILKRYEDGHHAFLTVRDERDRLNLQNGELKETLLEASRLLTLFALHDLTMEDVRAFMPKVEAMVMNKPLQEPPKKGEFPNKSVNGCKCPCHAEIAEDGVGWPCGEDECRPCHVEPRR